MMPFNTSDVYAIVKKTCFKFRVSIKQIKKQRKMHVDVDHVIGTVA